jgi:hypothetical protein
LDDWDAQQRVGCEQGSDDDRRNERIAKTEAKQSAEEQWHGSGKNAKDDRPSLGPTEEGNVDLEPGREHQQQFLKLGEEIRNRPTMMRSLYLILTPKAEFRGTWTGLHVLAS